MNGGFLAATERTLSVEGLATGSRSVAAGSLIVSTRAPIGYVAETTTPMAFNQGCRGLQPTSPLDTRFFRYQLLVMSGRLSAAGQGSTFVELPSESLAATQVTVPPLPEQRSIADYLDTETTRIDTLIAKKRRLCVLLNERENSLVDAVFGPDGERLVRLGRIARLQTGLTLDGNRTVQGDSVTAPYLRVANVQPGWLNLTEVKEVTVQKAVASRCLLRSGDVLMTEGGDLDKLGRGTVWHGEIEGCLHQNHVFAVRPDLGRLLADYLAMFTRTSYARRYFESTGTRSTNLASTNSSKVLDLRLPVLAVDEQQRRLRRYDSKATVINQSRQRLVRQIDLLVEHRQALITAAVTGELSLPRVAA